MNLTPVIHRSINYLTRSVDLNRSGIPYFMTFWHEGGMEYRHNPWDVVENAGRFSYGLALCRWMIGEDKPAAVERLWFEHLKTTWDERFGLYTVPKGWRFVQNDPDAAMYCGGLRERDDDVADMWENRSVYLGLVLSGRLFGDEERITWGRKVIDGFRRWAVRDRIGSGWCYPSHCLVGRERPDPEAPPVAGQNMGGILSVLVKDYEWFGENASLDLAVGLAGCMMRCVRLGSGWPLGFNVHSYFHYLAGLLRLYEKTADRRYLEYAKSHFDFYTPRLASRFGWVSEWPDADLMPNTPAARSKGVRPAAEGCGTIDLMDTAILLARNGFPDYWALVERVARNYLVCAQVREVSGLPPGRIAEDNEHSSFAEIPDRLVGHLAGWGDPNDIVNFNSRTGRRVFQACCGGHLPYGVFQAWDHAVSREGDTVSVNLSFDRETPFVRMVHTANGEGRFEIDLKTEAVLRLRVPEFVAPADLRVTVGGRAAAYRVDGVYADLGRLGRGMKVICTYPLARRTETEIVPVCGEPYQVEWAGTDVVAITPPGRYLPVFETRSSDAADPGTLREPLRV